MVPGNIICGADLRQPVMTTDGPPKRQADHQRDRPRGAKQFGNERITMRDFAVHY